MIGARTQPCFTPTSTGKLDDREPAMTTCARMPVWNCCNMAIMVGEQPDLHRMFERWSRLTESNAFVRSAKAIYKSLFCSRHSFLQLPGNKYHVKCAASTLEPALRFRQGKIYYVLEKTGEHDFSQHIACYREKGDATTVATLCSAILLLAYKNNVGIFPCCGGHLADQQLRIKLCSLLL